MDPVSHALLGAASGRSLARGHGRAAMLAGLAGALLPDADVLIGSGADPLLAVEYHRHFSHSFVAAPFGALVAAAAVWLILRRRTAYGVLYWAALAGFVSAILLDACTSYGTQLFWPFDDARHAWRVVSVVDPLMTLILLAGAIAALRSGTATPAWITLAAALAYLGGGWLQRERAETVARELATARGHAIERMEVKPTLGNLLLWRSIYLQRGEFAVDAVRVGPFSPPVVYAGGSVRRVTPRDLVPALAPGSVQANDVARFDRLSEGFLARHPDRPEVIGDVRYAMLPDSVRPLWGIAIDPAQPDRHTEFLTFRTFTVADRSRFLAMLRGVPDR